MTELKSCPFCGSKQVEVCNMLEEQPEMEQIGLTHDNWNVLCGDCFAMGGTRRTAADAIEAWNKRAEPERLKGRWIGTPITEGTGACPYFNGNVGDNRHNCVGAPFSCPCKQSSIWGKSTYHCSECGLEVGYSEKAKTNYCPNCGADMRGENDG